MTERERGREGDGEDEMDGGKMRDEMRRSRARLRAGPGKEPSLTGDPGRQDRGDAGGRRQGRKRMG